MSERRLSSAASRGVHWFTALLLALCAAAQPMQMASAGERITVIRDAHVILGCGEEIERGSIVIIDGRIAVVGRSVDVPRTAEVINAAGMTVMPGMVHARSRSGLRNYSRSGIRPHVHAFDELIAEDFEAEALLRAGYTAVAIIPAGTGIPGTAAVLRTGGDEDGRVLSESAYLRVVVSNAGQRRNLAQAIERAKGEIEKVNKAREEWEKQQAGGNQRPSGQGRGGARPAPRGGSAADEGGETPPAGEEAPAEPAPFVPPRIDPSLRPIVDLLEGRPGPAPVLELTSAADLLYLDQLLARHPEFPAERFFVDGGDIHLIAASLGARGAMVLTTPLLRNEPNTVIRVNVPMEFASAGAALSLLPVGRTDSTLSRAADLVRSGLDRGVAIRALTGGPAEFVGLGDRLGRIAEGYEADLVFLDGHPLDGVSRVQRVMILGDMVWESAR